MFFIKFRYETVGMTAKQTSNLLKVALVYAGLRQGFSDGEPTYLVTKEDVLASVGLMNMSMDLYIKFKVGDQKHL